MSIPEGRGHLIEDGIVAIFILEALKERASRGRRVPLLGLLAIEATSLIGALDECVQLLMPTRLFDVWDIGFNALAALMAVGSSLALSRVRRWGEKLFSRKTRTTDHGC